MSFIAIEPYRAEYEKVSKDGSDGLKFEWQPCRVLGVRRDDDGAYTYVIEVFAYGMASIEEAECIRSAQ